MSEKKITTVHIWNQYFQGRITDEDDSLAISLYIERYAEYFNDRSYMLELQRSKASDWVNWKRLQDQVVRDD